MKNFRGFMFFINSYKHIPPIYNTIITSHIAP